MSDEGDEMGDCPTRIVRDSPTDEDAFGAHRSVAKALASVITHEEGGRVVGLSGRWGSGKSTVIRLLRGALAEGGSAAHVWVFDAWAHEGDLLRQTFLEELAEHLGSQGWIDLPKWKKILQQLSGQRRGVEERVSPRFTGFGWAAAVSLLLVPIGAAIFKRALDQGVALRLSTEVDPGAALGLLFMLAPVVIAAGLATWVLAKNRWRASGKASNQPLQLKDALSPLVYGKVTDQYTETLHTPTTSSLEFERAFRGLMEDALGPNGRRLALVIDNLDRVAPDHALRIWSTLQTFLQQNSEPPSWLRRLWVVMPYDASSLKRLWQREGEQGELAASFLDKTFQVRIDVPPPLLSDWRDYLLRLLREALPAHDEDEFHSIYRLYAVNKEDAAVPPTPRELKLFVNRIAMLHLQRGHAVPLVHQAYYALQRRLGLDVRTLLLGDELPRPQDAGLVGDGVVDSLAALEFGVDQLKARQLLLTGPLTEALATGDAAVLGELLEHHAGAEAVLEQVLQSSLRDWLGGESIKILNSVIALDESGFLRSAPLPLRRLAIEELRDASCSVSEWKPLASWDPPGLLRLVEIMADRGFAEAMAVSYARTLGKQKAPASDEEAETRALHALNVAKGIRVHAPTAFANGIALPGTMEQFCVAHYAAATEQGDGPDSTYCYLFVPSVTPEAVTQFFEGAVREGRLGLPEYLVLRSVLRTGPKPDVAVLVPHLQQRISAGQSTDPDEVNALIGALRHLSTAPAKDAMQALAASGHLAHHFSLAVAAKKWEAAARCLVAHAEIFPDLSPRGSVGQSGAGFTQMKTYMAEPAAGLVSHAAVLLRNLGTPELALSILESNPDAGPLVGALANNLAERGTLIPASKFRELWPRMGSFADAEAVIGSPERASPLRDQAMDAGFSITLCSLYTGVLAHLPSEPAFEKWLVAGVQALTEEDWTAVIEQPEDLGELTRALSDRGHAFRVENDLRAALLSHAQALAQGHSAIEGGLDWLIALLDHTNRDVFRDELVDVPAANAGLTSPFVSTFGSELAESERLRTENSVVTSFFEPLVGSRDGVGLAWLADYAESRPRFLDSFRDSYRKVFRKRLSEELRDAEDGLVLKALGRLGAVLQVKKARPALFGGSTEG